jgi:hypothetical protein
MKALFFTLLSVSSQASELRCRYIFSPMDAVSKKILAFDSGSGDTTSLRQEDKYVLEFANIKAGLDQLQAHFGLAMKERDASLPGQKNITVTEYLEPYSFSTGAEQGLKFKVRFRKYFVQDAQKPILDASMKPAEFVKESQFVEFKIDHPDFPSAVIKPRIVMSDADVVLLHSRESYLQNRTQMIARLGQMNPKKSEEIARFIDVFDVLFIEHQQIKLVPYLQTAYVRESYSVKVASAKDPNVKLDIQLTVDHELDLTILENGQKVKAYKDSAAVIEIKIPVHLAKLSEKDIQEYPGLAEIKRFIEKMSDEHLPEYQKGSGKLYHAKRELLSR